MRNLTWSVFLTLIMVFAGCGDTADDGDEAGAGNGAAGETPMEQAPTEEATAMDEGDSDVPAWQVLEQNVVHPE